MTVASLSLPIAYDLGDGQGWVEIKAGPAESIAFERRYQTSITKAVQDGELGAEAIAYLCYAYCTNRNLTSLPFEEWFRTLAGIGMVAADESPTAPDPAVLSGSLPS